MGNCGSSLNCTQCYADPPDDGCLSEIKVDADIAGIGVLTAFFLAALVTCISIFMGYCTDSLPYSLLSETDEAAIRLYQRSFIAKRVFPTIGRLWFSIKSMLYHCAWREPPKPRSPIPREQRVEAVTRFVLGFSDQQLVTGLAILIAALANRCHLTLYELQIVFCLAWFSATTHVSTLKVLREYFYDHAVVRNWRVIGIFIFLVLITFVRVVLIFAGDPSSLGGVNYGRPIQCIINGHDRRTDLGPYEVYSETYPLLFLVIMYGYHTILLFKDPRKLHKPSCIAQRIVAALRGKPLSTKTLEEKQVIDQNAQLQHQIMLSSVSSQKQHGLNTYSRFTYSFLSYIPVVMFIMTYGITKTIFLIWIDNPKITDDVRRLGFGQVVAIALLAVPVLVAAEIYNEVRAVPSDNITDGVEKTEAPEPSPKVESDVEYQYRKEELGISDNHEAAPLLLELSHRIEAQIGTKEIDPRRRDLIVYLSLEYLYTRRRGAQFLKFLRRTHLFLLDASVGIVTGITLNTTPILGIVLVATSIWLEIMHWIHRSKRHHRLIRLQRSFCETHKKWMGTPRSKAAHRDALKSLLLLHDGLDEGDGSAEKLSERDSLELPKRQDTEADIAVVTPAMDNGN